MIFSCQFELLMYIHTGSPLLNLFSHPLHMTTNFQFDKLNEALPTIATTPSIYWNEIY